MEYRSNDAYPLGCSEVLPPVQVLAKLGGKLGGKYCVQLFGASPNPIRNSI
jgi:hypothetical protein